MIGFDAIHFTFEGILFKTGDLNLDWLIGVNSRDGRPAPRGTLPAGRGGFPAPPRTVGRGGFPAPTRPVKMIKTAGKLRGKINTRISTFSKRGNK